MKIPNKDSNITSEFDLLQLTVLLGHSAVKYENKLLYVTTS
jgi:hypothetical protein